MKHTSNDIKPDISGVCAKNPRLESNQNRGLDNLRRLGSRGYVRRFEKGRYEVIDPVLKSYVKEKFSSNNKSQNR